MCLRQINVLSLPGSQEPIYYNLSLDPASVQIASVCLIIQLGYIGGLHLNDGKSVNISDSSDGVSIANFFYANGKEQPSHVRLMCILTEYLPHLGSICKKDDNDEDNRDDHGNGIPNGNGNPTGIPWEWELMTKLGMGMGGNEKQPVWEWEWLLFPWE